jgi:hypothetical protein
VTDDRRDDPTEPPDSGSGPMIFALVGAGFLLVGTIVALGYLGCQAAQNAKDREAEAVAAEQEATRAAREKAAP